MLYALLKIYARLALKVYCTRVVINQPQWLHEKGPLLLAANHPNSFLDGIIATTLFEAPVYSLARGDAFRHPRMNRWLRSLQLLPVYRTSEGVANLEHNYTTFAACRKTFEDGGIVLIFSEGRCENEWHLRPLKKGTARLAITAWQQGIPLRVVPLGFNYSSFKSLGKDVHLLFGDPITVGDIDFSEAEGRQFNRFNTLLEAQLQQLVYEIPEDSKEKKAQYFPVKKDLLLYLLLLPALVGWIVHAPLYYGCKAFTNARFRHSGHYDSVLTSLLVMGYLPYLLLIFLAALFLQCPWAGATWLLFPFTAWAAVRVKRTGAR